MSEQSENMVIDSCNALWKTPLLQTWYKTPCFSINNIVWSSHITSIDIFKYQGSTINGLVWNYIKADSFTMFWYLHSFTKFGTYFYGKKMFQIQKMRIAWIGSRRVFRVVCGLILVWISFTAFVPSTVLQVCITSSMCFFYLYIVKVQRNQFCDITVTNWRYLVYTKLIFVRLWRKLGSSLLNHSQIRS